MTGRNPWVVLWVAEDAPYHEVQRAFRRRVKQTHPDGGGDALEFATVVLAFDVVRQVLPPRDRRSLTRPTPYDPWLRPSRPTGTGSDADHPEPLAFRQSGGISMTPSTRPTGNEFTTILLSEMSKAQGLQALVD